MTGPFGLSGPLPYWRAGQPETGDCMGQFVRSTTGAAAISVGHDYYALLARHDASRLRRSILGGAPTASAAGAGLPSAALYDGVADREVILAHIGLVLPFDALIEDLYDVMFERRPYLRALFPESMAFQRTRLARMFDYLVDRLHRPEEIAETFARLGRDHRKLGVRPAHYQAFEDALGEALRRRGGTRWTAAAEDAWLRMLRFAVAAMVDGADAALTEPPYWRATVVDHRLPLPDTAVIRIRPHEPYAYAAGQYAAVESPLVEQAWRAYRLVSTPGPDGEVEFHVRATGAGGVNDALVFRIGVGDVVRLGPPRVGGAPGIGRVVGDEQGGTAALRVGS